MSALEELRWKKFECLNDGFICLVDAMGDESSIVQAARVSYGEGTKSVSDDYTLLRYLYRQRHTTPFEMVDLKFMCRAPIHVARQWFRHRTWSYNEYSTRYSKAIDSTEKTDADKWRAQSSSNKQGSGEFLDPIIGSSLTLWEEGAQVMVRQDYELRLMHGVAREQARKDLPLSTYTEFYGKVNLHNLLHFLGLRMDSHAQYEIRVYANAIGEMIKQLYPTVWEAFEDYRLNAMYLTGLDVAMCQEINNRLLAFPVDPDLTWDSHGELLEITKTLEPFKSKGWDKERCREREDCIDKLKTLGIL